MLQRPHTYVALLLFLTAGALFYAVLSSSPFHKRAEVFLTAEGGPAPICEAKETKEPKTNAPAWSSGAESDEEGPEMGGLSLPSQETFQDTERSLQAQEAGKDTVNTSPPHDPETRAHAPGHASEHVPDLSSSLNSPDLKGGDREEKAFDAGKGEAGKERAETENHDGKTPLSLQEKLDKTGPREEPDGAPLGKEGLKEGVSATTKIDAGALLKEGADAKQKKGDNASSLSSSFAEPSGKGPGTLGRSPSQEAPPGLEKRNTTYTNPEGLPEIVLIVQGLGRRQETLDLALALPPEVTLAFYSFEGVKSPINRARGKGHETLLMIPMEPLEYPQSDPGPMTLLTGLDPSENLYRLQTHLHKAQACVGVMPFQGSRFLVSEKDLKPFFEVLQEHNLVFIDATKTRRSVAKKLALQGAFALQEIHRPLDRILTKEALLKELTKLEHDARAEGRAYAITQDTPLGLKVLKLWAEGLGAKKIRLAPVSVCFTAKEATP